uniref:Uncharacterized protein n=1 Tax=Opuntia streptacantha TaxID=393608 RepID=A0A7C9E1U0_OPUST
MSSLARNKVGGVSPSIVVNWVCKVVVKVLNGPLSSHNGLDEEPEHGEHGQPTILDLLHLQLREGLWVIGQPKWVKSPTRVDFVEPLTQWPTGNPITLDKTHQNHLASPNG